MTWVRVETNVPDNDKVQGFAAALGIAIPQAVGHIVCVWGKVADHRWTGNLKDVLDDTLETWALWSGERGAFARAFRGAFMRGDRLQGWRDRQGKLIERLQKDRRRKNRRAEDDA